MIPQPLSFARALTLFCLLVFLPMAAGTAEGAGRDLRNLKFEPVDLGSSGPSGAVTDIVQGPDGFIWFGTREGAHRFDGYEVRTYANEKENSDSLVNSAALTFHVDERKRLWIGTEKGVARFVPETDSFKNYLLDRSDFNSNHANHANAIDRDSQGQIFASSESGYVYRFDEEADKFVRVNEAPFGIIKSMVFDDEDRLWIGSSNALRHYDPKTGETRTFREPFTPEDPTEESFIESICFVDRENIWIGAGYLGPILFNGVTGESSRPPIASKGEENVQLIKKDADGNLWIGHSGGITLYPPGGGEPTRYDARMREGALPESGITSLLIDKQGNVWTGSAYHGLFVSTNNKLFRRFEPYLGRDGSARVVVSSLLADSKGDLWVGRNSTGIDVFPGDGGPAMRLRPDEGDERSVSLSAVCAISEDLSGDIWVGTSRGGLQKFNRQTGDFTRYAHVVGDPTSIAGNDVRGIQVDERGNLWVLTRRQGVCYFDKETGKFSRLRHDDAEPQATELDDWGNALLYASDGKLFVGTDVGLRVYDTGTGESRSFTANPSEPGTLSNSAVNTLYEDRSGRIWVGTSDGINLYDAPTSSFTSWSVEHGLPNRVVGSIVEDAAGSLWIGTDNGLARFDPDTKNIDSYDAADGLSDSSFYARSVTKGADGTLYFGTKNGVTLFAPEEIEDNTRPPDVWITDVRVFNRSLPVLPDAEGKGVLRASVMTTDRIDLTHEQKVVTLNFVALNFIQPGKNRYAYRLLGFDQEWNQVGTRREATYTNLNPGHYVFQVKASNNDGYWNEDPRELLIAVEPPFWGAVWFLSLATVAVVAIPGFLVFWRLRSVKRQKLKLARTVQERTGDLSAANEKLERAYAQLEKNQFQIQMQNRELMTHRENLELMVSQRTQELEAAKEKAERSDRLKSAFLANMSHEIRTPMNAIIGLLDIVRLEGLSEEERDRYNDVIKQSSSTLMTLIDDILDLSRIESGEATVQLQICNIDEVCEELYALFRHIAATESQGRVALRLVRNGVEGANSSRDGDLLAPDFDPVRLKQILTNLLSNAIKFTDYGVVTFGYKTIVVNGATRIQFFVEDTGIGIPEDQLRKVFERFHKVEAAGGRVYRGTGLGLTISQRLAEMMGGSISVESKVGEGTCFMVSFERLPVEGVGLSYSKVTGSLEKSRSRDSDTIPRGLSILVAEDEEPNFLVVEKYLQRIAARVEWAKNGAEAIRRFEDSAFDLILMDVKMPMKDGYETLKHIRSVDTEIPVIMQTAYAMDSDRRKAMELGATGFLAKPFFEESLIACIESSLRSRSV